MTGRSKGFGFCRFGDEAERDRAIIEMAGHFINNRPIRVSTATAKKAPTTPFPANSTDRKQLVSCFSHVLMRQALISSVGDPPQHGRVHFLLPCDSRPLAADGLCSPQLCFTCRDTTPLRL